jgi:hypothetical protein
MPLDKPGKGLPAGGNMAKIQPCAGTVVRLSANLNLIAVLCAALYAGKISVPAGIASSTFPARGGIVPKQAQSRQPTKRERIFATGSRWIPNTGPKPQGIRKRWIKPNPQKPLLMLFLLKIHDG